MMRSLFGVSMLMGTCAQEACSSDGIEAMAMVQRVNRKAQQAAVVAHPLTQLLQATTKMLKDGTTPAVVTFTADTLDEIKKDIIPAIKSNHLKDQTMLDDQLKELQALLVGYKADEDVLEANNGLEETAHDALSSCRGAVTGDEPAGSEAALCLDASHKNKNRADAWATLKLEENHYIGVSRDIHGRFCPTIGDTWHTRHDGVSKVLDPGHMTGDIWTPGDINPMVADLEKYRSGSTKKMETFAEKGTDYFAEIPLWEETERLALAANTSHTDKKEVCDGLQKTLEEKSCARAQHHAEFIKVFLEEWNAAELIMNKTKDNIVVTEADRVREFVTLNMVECLLTKISARNGTRCEESGEAEAEIQNCESQDVTTEELEIDYPCAPEMPDHMQIKVFPGQPEAFWTSYYTPIESHGFCFSDKPGHVDHVTDTRLNNQFPLPVIHNKECELVDYSMVTVA